jgi:hypothetical protein
LSVALDLRTEKQITLRLLRLSYGMYIIAHINGCTVSLPGDTSLALAPSLKCKSPTLSILSPLLPFPSFPFPWKIGITLKVLRSDLILYLSSFFSAALLPLLSPLLSIPSYLLSPIAYLFLDTGTTLWPGFTPLKAPMSLKEFRLDVFTDPTHPTRVPLGEEVWDVFVRILPGSMRLLNTCPPTPTPTPRPLLGKGGSRTSTSSEGPCSSRRGHNRGEERAGKGCKVRGSQCWSRCKCIKDNAGQLMHAEEHARALSSLISIFLFLFSSISTLCQIAMHDIMQRSAV